MSQTSVRIVRPAFATHGARMDFTKQIAEDLRLLVEDVQRRLEAALQPFADSLDDFLARLFQARLPSDWRRRWHAFVADQADQGFFVEDKSVQELEDWIESCARFCDLLPVVDAIPGLSELIAKQADAVDRLLAPENRWASDRESEKQIAFLCHPGSSQPSREGAKPRASGAPKRVKPNPPAKVAEPERSDVAPVVVTKSQLPAAHRGHWVQGTPGESTFRFNDLPENQKVGMAGKEVRFKNQHIAVGGFPPEKYYGGSAASATVEIAVVRGTGADALAADAAMRATLRDPNWQRPQNYVWNHAGEPGSKMMELVLKDAHKATSHKGGASQIRAQRRAARGRAMGILNVYLLPRLVLQTAGILQPDYSVAERETYHFVAEDGSVFFVWPAGWISSARREFIRGPRQGQKEGMTNAEVEACRGKAEEMWGKYIPGSLFSQPRFMPGTQRSTLPVFREYRGLPQEIGWIDEKGVHYYTVPKQIII